MQPHLRGRCAQWRRAKARFLNYSEPRHDVAECGRPPQAKALVVETGARALAAAIASNATLTRLELKYNMFGFDGAKALLEVGAALQRARAACVSRRILHLVATEHTMFVAACYNSLQHTDAARQCGLPQIVTCACP